MVEKKYMKKKLFLLTLGLLTLSSCKKENTHLPEDNCCIERVIIPVTAHDLKASDILLVNNLFLNNNIDNRNFRYNYFSEYSAQLSNLSEPKTDIKSVVVDQYSNGLRILNSSIQYYFYNNIFKSVSNEISKGTSLNIQPHLKLSELRKLYIKDVKLRDKDLFNLNDTCIKAEFGYYNINSYYDKSREQLIKAWKVTPKNGNFPVAYYKDEDGGYLYYWNGLFFQL